VAASVRDARPCRFACHARSAVPRVASTPQPQVTRLIPSFGSDPAYVTEEQQAAVGDGIAPSANAFAHLRLLHAFWPFGLFEHYSLGAAYFVDRPPKVSESGGELAENHDRHDSTARRRRRIVIGLVM
jgi:hypothetical protein